MIFTLIGANLLSGVQNSRAEENEAKLNGTYAFNATMLCSVGGSGPGPTLHLQGLLTFDGAGNGESAYVSLVLPNEYEVSGSFTYSVDEYNYFTIVQELSLEVSPGNFMTIENAVDEGWIGHGGQTLVISSNSNAELVTMPDSSEYGRWCVRSGTANKVSKL